MGSAHPLIPQCILYKCQETAKIEEKKKQQRMIKKQMKVPAEQSSKTISKC
jgi:hypothetical protein